MSFIYTSYFDLYLSNTVNDMHTIIIKTQIDWKAVFKLSLSSISILNSILHLFSTFRQKIRATKIVTLNLWRVGRVKRQRRNAICSHWILLSQDTVLSNLRSKQCSVTIRSVEHRIQGGVKFGQVKGSSSCYIWSANPDIISLRRTSQWQWTSFWVDTARRTLSPSCLDYIRGGRHVSS